MKKYFLVVVIIISASCSNSNKKMRIANTSVNDVYDNFVFDFDNSVEGLKMINDYVVKDIQESKHFTDSLVKKIEGFSEEEVIKFWKENNLPTKGSNVNIYVAREDLNLDVENNNDLLMTYFVDEDSFQVTDFHVKYKSESQNKKITNELVDEGNSTFKLADEDLTIEALAVIKKQIDELKFHRLTNEYSYSVKNNKEKDLVKISFKNRGNTVALIYN